jgi:arylformamidase
MILPIRNTGLNMALKLTDREIAELSPLLLPTVQKPLAIAYGSAELPALVWDSRNFHTARKAAGAPGDLVAIEGADRFIILEELRRLEADLG